VVGQVPPGVHARCHTIRIDAIDTLPARWPQVQVLVDAAYRGLANYDPGQVHPTPLPPPKVASEPVHEQ
jgi:hypothetical protein